MHLPAPTPQERVKQRSVRAHRQSEGEGEPKEKMGLKSIKNLSH